MKNALTILTITIFTIQSVVSMDRNQKSPVERVKESNKLALKLIKLALKQCEVVDARLDKLSTLGTLAENNRTQPSQVSVVEPIRKLQQKSKKIKRPKHNEGPKFSEINGRLYCDYKDCALRKRGSSYQDFKSFYTHEYSYHSKFKCSCGLLCIGYSSLRSHKRNCGRPAALNPPKKRKINSSKLMCPHKNCEYLRWPGKGFAAKGSLRAHLRKYHKEYSCDCCDRIIIGLIKFNEHKANCKEDVESSLSESSLSDSDEDVQEPPLLPIDEGANFIEVAHDTYLDDQGTVEDIIYQVV